MQQQLIFPVFRALDANGGDAKPSNMPDLVFANHPSSEFHSSDPGWMNDSRFNGTAGSQ